MTLVILRGAHRAGTSDSRARSIGRHRSMARRAGVVLAGTLTVGLLATFSVQHHRATAVFRVRGTGFSGQ
ncbi:hypothetical protein [Streptomyces sp. NPDC014733]|uniref:hypothetical protein n=1 Tax=Streptomyces sp. NPDC014733 TaxID=3364885 RepID=UPI0036F8BA4B